MSSEALMPQSAYEPTNKQRLFARYLMAILIDLAILNFFVEYSGKVFVDSFTTSFLAAIVLQILLKVTIVCEHWVMDWFKARGGGGFMTFLKYFCAWLILFGSKFVILEALTFVFGKDIHFEGLWHGIIWLIIVVVTMVIVEDLIVRLYRKLA